MTFGGKFADSLVVEQLDKLSVSFLVDDLEIRRGGVAANMCFGLGRLGLRAGARGRGGRGLRRLPLLAGAARRGLRRTCAISDTQHTARFVCTTDTTGAQFASFYPGAMSEARLVELAPIVARRRRAVVRPDRRRRPRRDAAPHRGVPQARLPVHRRPEPAARVQRGRADPQPHRRRGVPVLQRVRVAPDRAEDRLVGRRGARPGRHPGDHARRGRRADHAQGRGRRSSCPRRKDVVAVEPTGVGDAFRAGFLAALAWGLELEHAAQVGCVLAAYVVETVGPQDYTFTAEQFLARLDDSYGGDAADAVGRTSPDGSASAEPAHQVAGHAVVGAVLADVLLLAHPAPGRDVVRARPASSATHRDDLADLDLGDPLRPSSMTGQRAGMPAAVQLEVASRSQARPPRGSRRRPRAARRGSRRRRPRSCPGSARPGRCRGSARPSPPARGWARASRRCTPSRSPRRTRAGPARHDRLAVDVEEGERHQVGEPVDRVADHLDVGDRGDRGPDPVDQRELAGVDLVALGDHRLQGRGGRRGRPGRSRSR